MANMTNFSPASDAGNVKTEAPPSGPATSGLALAANGNGNAPTSKPKSKPRKRVNTAEKRNQHNAIERARRETLNGKFISLARLLPSLATVRRPSKSAIVNGSISHLTHQRDQRLLAARLLRSLCAERDALVKECNEWRYANGLPARDDVSSWSDEVEEVCNVEKEQFGTFSGMFEGGDDGDNENENQDGDGEDDGVNNGDMSNSFSMPMFGNQQQHQHQPTSYGVGEMTIEQAAAIAAQASFGPNGLLTPRTSTDMSMSGSGVLAASWAQQNFGSNQAANNNGNVNSFIPSSLSSSTASLPFNAFMSNDSNSDSPASNPGSGFSHMATPPTTGFLNGLSSTMQHTPSPSSSHSFEDGVPAAGGNNVNGNAAPQWTEQQLLLLRALQHQQHLRQRQNLSTLQMQQLQGLQNFNPLTLGLGLNGNGQGNVGGNANGLGGHSAFSTGNGNVNGLASSPTGTDSPFNLFNSVNMQHGASQFNQAMFNNANGPSPTSAGLGSNANGNTMVPPPLSRAQTENLEAWRKMSAMPNNFRTNVPLGLTLEQLQQARSVEGF